jgi:hypothetical protein
LDIEIIFTDDPPPVDRPGWRNRPGVGPSARQLITPSEDGRMDKKAKTPKKPKQPKKDKAK